MGQPPAKVRAPDFYEQAVIQAYRDGLAKGWESADGAAQAILTASFSIATAYGALIGLVAPKDDPGPIVLALPFVGFAIAALAAMWARARSMAIVDSNQLDDVTDAFRTGLEGKRFAAWVAVGALVLSLIVAGFVLADTYGSVKEDPATTAATVYLTPEAAAGLEPVCGGPVGTLTGSVANASIGAEFLVIDVDANVCGDQAASLRIPRSAVSAVVTSE